MDTGQVGMILDTSVLIAKERAHHSVRQVLEQIRSEYGDIETGLSVITVAELVHGAYRAKTEFCRLGRLRFVDELCRDIPVFPMTLPIAKLIGQIEGQQAASGNCIPFEDLAIGVTALYLGYAVSTLNSRHFALIPGLKIISH